MIKVLIILHNIRLNCTKYPNDEALLEGMKQYFPLNRERSNRDEDLIYVGSSNVLLSCLPSLKASMSRQETKAPFLVKLPLIMSGLP